MKKIIILLLGLVILTGCIKKLDVVNYKKISVANAYQTIYKENNIYTLIDVRTKEEYEEGHLKNAINIPYDKIKAAKLPNDKKSIIILYCRSGVRAEKAAKTLLELGFTNVSTFGGIVDWTYKDEIVK